MVVLVGVFLNQLFALVAPDLYLNGSHLVQLPVADSLGEFLSFFTLPDFSQITNTEIYTTAFTLAVVASLETLLSVEATDKLDPEQRVTPTNLELKAQGVGNIVAGLMGGIPVTQVVVRSSANIDAGGKTRMASLFHGLFLFLSAALIASTLNKIPLSALAAILLLVGYKLANVSVFRQMWKSGWQLFFPFIVTVLALIFTDMLTGVLLGLAVGAFLILLYNYRTDYYREEGPGEKEYTIHLSEHISFLNKAGVMKALREIPRGSTVTIDVSRTVVLDPDVREIIIAFVTRAKLDDIAVALKGMENISTEPRTKETS
jgi:carbonic anhydrase